MGSEVINNYGALSNAQLLQRYGYVEAELNPNDCAEVSIWELFKSIKQLPGQPLECTSMSSRLLFLKKHGLLPRGGWFQIHANKSPPVDLTECLRVLTISNRQFHKLKQDVEDWRIPRVRPMHFSTRGDFVLDLSVSLKMFAEMKIAELKHGQGLLTESPHLSTSKTHIQMATVVLESELKALTTFQYWLQHNSQKLLKHPKSAWKLVRRCGKDRK